MRNLVSTLLKRSTLMFTSFVLAVSSLSAAMPLFLSQTANAVGGTVVVSGNTSAGENQPGWLFNRDLTTKTPFVFNSDAASIGTGSLYVKPIGANASDKMIAENFLGASISDINSVSYDFKVGTGGNATSYKQFYMNVYANFGESSPTKFYDCRYNVVPSSGSTANFTTTTFDPTQNYTVATSGSSPHTCPTSPSGMDALSTGNSVVRVFALNIGDTSTVDAGLSGYLDNVVVNLDSAGVTTSDFEAPVIDSCTSTTTVNVNSLSAWDVSDTRATGHYSMVPGGVHVWTESNTSTDKVAAYYPTNFPLSALGVQTPVESIEYTTNSGAIAPSSQLVVDFDNNGTPDGILVGEVVYGSNWWLTNSTPQPIKDNAPHNGGGNGSAWYGTANEWLGAFPNATVKAVGFSLGSGVQGDYVINKISAGCVDYRFGVINPTLTVTTPSTGQYVSTKANSNKLKITGSFTDDIKANYATFQLVHNGSSVAIGTIYGFGSVWNPTATYAATDGSYTYNLPVPANLASGNYSLFYTGTDFEGGVTNRMERTFIVDNENPAGAVNYSGGNRVGNIIYLQTINDLQYSLSLTDNMQLEHTSYAVWKTDSNFNNRTLFCGNWNGAITSESVSGTSTNPSGHVKDCSPLGNWSDGSYVIMHVVYDAAGNLTYFGDTYPGQKFVIDSSASAAPTNLQWLNSSDNSVLGANTNQNPTTPAWDAPTTGTVSHYEYSFRSPTSGWSAWSSVGNVTNLGPNSFYGAGNTGTEGEWQYRVRTINNFGVASPEAESPVINYDRTAPTVAILTTGTQSTATPTISGTVDADATNLVFTIDGITQPLTWAAGSTTWTSTPTTALADGTHNMSIVATDSAGNQGGQAGTITISVPVTLLTAAPGGTTPTPQATVTPGEVLGDQTTNEDIAKTGDNKTNQSPSILGDATTNNPMNLFGLAWYWWLTILAAIIAIWWIIAAALRRRDNQNV